MAEKDDARRNIEQARDSMSEIAEELMRRSSPVYLKTRAKEAAVRKTTETKERVETTVKESPMAWKLIGGAVGVGLASMLSKRYQARDRLEFSQYGYGYAGEQGRGLGWQQPARVDYRDSAVAADSYGYGAGSVATAQGYGPSTPTAGVYAEPLGGEAALIDERSLGLGEREPGLKDRAASKASEIKERAADAKAAMGDKAGHLKERLSHAKDSARERVSHAKDTAKERVSGARHSAGDRLQGARGRLDGVRERLPSRDEVKLRTQEKWHRGVENDPLAILLGAVALGAAASFLLPVSDRERRLTAPARDRVRGKLQEVKHEATSRLDQVREQALDQLSTLKGQAMESVEQLKGQALESAQQLKGQAMDDLKGKGSQSMPEAPEGASVSAHADQGGVSYAATLPLERDEQFRSEGLVEHTPGERPKDSPLHGSYDPKLPH